MPALAVFTPEAMVWLMLFSTMEPQPGILSTLRPTPRSSAKPKMAATLEPASPKPSLSPM